MPALEDVIPEGKVAVNKKTGEKAYFYKGRWNLNPPEPAADNVIAGAEQRGRVALGLGPSVEAQKRMNSMQAQFNQETGQMDRRNPYKAAPIASALDSMGLEGAARTLGGQDYQSYDQAAKSFESSLLPIFSGSAVTPTEASRFIRANLPVWSDTPETLVEKERNRSMILNAAAKMLGTKLPFPDVPTWGVTPQGEKKPQAQGAPNAQMPRIIDFNDLPE